MNSRLALVFPLLLLLVVSSGVFASMQSPVTKVSSSNVNFDSRITSFIKISWNETLDCTNQVRYAAISYSGSKMSLMSNCKGILLIIENDQASQLVSFVQRWHANLSAVIFDDYFSHSSFDMYYSQYASIVPVIPVLYSTFSSQFDYWRQFSDTVILAVDPNYYSQMDYSIAHKLAPNVLLLVYESPTTFYHSVNPDYISSVVDNNTTFCGIVAWRGNIY